MFVGLSLGRTASLAAAPQLGHQKSMLTSKKGPPGRGSGGQGAAALGTPQLRYMSKLPAGRPTGNFYMYRSFGVPQAAAVGPSEPLPGGPVLTGSGRYLIAQQGTYPSPIGSLFLVCRGATPDADRRPQPFRLGVRAGVPRTAPRT